MPSVCLSIASHNSETSEAIAVKFDKVTDWLCIHENAHHISSFCLTLTFIELPNKAALLSQQCVAICDPVEICKIKCPHNALETLLLNKNPKKKTHIFRLHFLFIYFSLQSSSIHFLVQQGFDFNKLFREGECGIIRHCSHKTSASPLTSASNTNYFPFHQRKHATLSDLVQTYNRSHTLCLTTRSTRSLIAVPRPKQDQTVWTESIPVHRSHPLECSAQYHKRIWLHKFLPQKPERPPFPLCLMPLCNTDCSFIYFVLWYQVLLLQMFGQRWYVSAVSFI